MRLLLILFLLPWFAYSQPGVTRIGSPNGTTVIQGGIGLTENSSATSISSNQDNYTLPNYSTWNVNATTDVEFTGFTAVSGKRIEIVNRGTGNITLKHLTTSSSANQLSLPGAVDYVIAPSTRISIKYSDYDSKWIINFGSELGVINLPPPTQQVSNITFSDIGSAGATANISRGNGDGVIVLISTSPISQFPSNNVAYTADANFGDGDNINSSGVYVIGYGDISSVVITGLSAGTIYYVTALEFATSGPLISYNFTPDFNSTNFTTLSNASTPTTQWVNISTKSYENAIEVTGTRGNGDAFLVIANDSIPVSVDPADGANYPAGSYGAGYNFGERNYSVFNGTDNPFGMTGLVRDKKYYFKVMEYETTGYLYNTQATVDSAYVAFTYDSTFIAGSGTPPGEAYLTASADLWYDFSNLTFADEANITNGDAGLNDIGPGTSTATILGSSPQTNEISFNGTHKTARTGNGTGIDVNNQGDSWFSRADGFEIHGSAQISDGVNGSASVFTSLCGYVSGSNQVAIRVMWNGSLRAEYRDGVAASNTSMTTASGVLVDGVNTFTYSVRWDFTNDIVSMWVNNTPVSLSLLSGVALSSQDPTNFNSGHDFVVGNQANNGTLVGNTNTGVTLSTAQFAVTGLLTSDQRTAIHEEFNFTATAGGAFLDWDVTEGTGFTYETENDTLKLSAGSAAFTDYLKHKDVLADSLQEYVISSTFKIASAPTTNPSSFIIGARNLTTSEANYGVWGHINLDSDAGSFGAVQMFSGTGVSGDGNWAFRAGSSGTFEPAEDSVYTALFERDIQGNNAFYSFTVIDNYDSAVLTIGWTESNRPSSAYYGTTMRPFIGYQGDTEIHVAEFSVTRTGDAQVDSSPPPTPTTYDFRASKDGDDANDCTDANPCFTVNRTVAAANASGGSGKTIGIGPGVFLENSASVLGTNIGLFEGSGVGNTVIQADQNFFALTSAPTSHDAAVIRLSSGSSSVESHVSHVINLKDFTIDGNGRQARQGLYIRGRDDWEINNVTIRNFNWCGAWIRYADDFEVNELIIENSGGDILNTPPCNNMNPQVATGGAAEGSNLAGLLTWDIANATFNGGGVYNTMFRSGYAHKAQNSSTDNSGTYVNVRFNNMDFVTNDQSNYFSAGGIMLKTISFELHSGSQVTNLDSLVFEGCLFQGGFFSFFEYNNAASTGGVRMTGNTFDPGVWPFRGDEPFAAIEAYVNNLKFNRNYVYSSETFYVNNSRSSAPFDYSNWDIQNNIFKVRPKNNSAIGAIVKAQHHTLLNIYIGNNTIWHTSPTLGEQAWVSFNTADAGLPAATVTIENNAGYGDLPSGSNNKGIIKLGNAGKITATVRYNKATHARVTQTGTGITQSNNTITGAGNSLLFNLTGPEFPVTQNSYFGWTTNAQLDGTGQGGSSIGAWEP